MKVLIYTSIFGDYDKLRIPPKQTIDCSFMCCSNPHYELGKSNILQAKYYKLLPHRMLPYGQEFDYTLWVDGSIQINSPEFAEYMVSQARDSWALFQHDGQTCIKGEALGCWNMRKYITQPIMKQVDHYFSLGMPQNFGVWYGGVICRNTKNTDVVAMDEFWWQENLKWSIQDQISLPYILWTTKGPINTCTLPKQNPLFSVYAGHRYKDYEIISPT